MDVHSRESRQRPVFRTSAARRHRSSGPKPTLALVGAAVAVAAMVALLAFGPFAHARTASPALAQAASSAPASAKAAASRSAGKKRRTHRAVTTSSKSRAKQPRTVKPADVAAKVPSAKPAPRKLALTPAPAKRRVASAHGPSLTAYKGLASWVDMYDTGAMNDPAAAVKDMAAHGVKTLFVETGNFHTSPGVNDPSALSTFLRECHARHILVVAWYLPDLKSGSADFARITKAINFTTADGQKFDSFALDIEATEVKSVTSRNAGLASLSKRIRALVGSSYPLGAIIPSPVGLSEKKGYWDVFPYATCAQYYDVLVPMGYYTYHGKGATAARSDAAANVRILRSQKGCATKPIHLIGGISDDSSTSQVQGFVRAVRDAHCFGASLYGWAGTSKAAWKALGQVK